MLMTAQHGEADAPHRPSAHPDRPHSFAQTARAVDAAGMAGTP